MDAEAEWLAFLEPQETAAALLARTFVAPLRSGVPAIDQHTALRPGHVVEIIGGPAVAKSELLLQAAVSCVLSRGNGDAAEQCLHVDLSGKFDIVRLMDVLEQRVTARQPPDPSRDEAHTPLEAGSLALNAALARLHLVQCHNSMELLAALASIPAICAASEALGPFRLLLIDDISAFHWLDVGVRADSGLAGARSDGTRAGIQKVHAAIATLLRKVTTQHRLIVMMARSTAQPELCRPLADLPTHRLSMSQTVDEFGTTHFVAKWQASSAIPQAFVIRGGRIERTM